MRERGNGEPRSKIRLKRLWQLAVQHESWVDELESMEEAVSGWECKAYRCSLLLRGCGFVATRIESRLSSSAVKLLPPVSTIIGLAGIATTLSWTLATESSSDWAGALPFLSETGARPPRYFVFLFLPGTAALLTLLVIALAAEGHELALAREPASPHRGGAFTTPYGVVVLGHLGCASALALLLTVAVSTDFFQPLHAASSYVFFASYFAYAVGNALFHHKRRGSRGTWETPWIRAKICLVSWPFFVLLVAVIAFFTLTVRQYFQVRLPLLQGAARFFSLAAKLQDPFLSFPPLCSITRWCTNGRGLLGCVALSPPPLSFFLYLRAWRE